MIGCLTIKHYPAWALSLVKRCDPTRPLMVQEEGHIVALNRHAARAGLEVGMTAARARSFSPTAILLIRDSVSEYCAWEYVIDRLHRVTPFLQSRCPCAWFDSGREDILHLAAGLRACVGFAPDRTTAHLAAVRAHPGRITHVRASDVSGFLDTFPTELLHEAGLSEETVQGLLLMGFDTLKPARGLSERQLELAFGEEGKRLKAILNPRPGKPPGLYHPPPCIRDHFDLEAPCSHPGDLLPIVSQLVEKTASVMQEQFAGQIRIALHLEGSAPVRATRVLPHPTSRADTLDRYGLRLAGEMLAGLNEQARHSGRRPVDIDRVELALASLMTGDLVQASLFGEKIQNVRSAVSEVHRRYPNMVKRGQVRPGAHFHEDRFGLRVWNK